VSAQEGNSPVSTQSWTVPTGVAGCLTTSAAVPRPGKGAGIWSRRATPGTPTPSSQRRGASESAGEGSPWHNMLSGSPAGVPTLSTGSGSSAAPATGIRRDPPRLPLIGIRARSSIRRPTGRAFARTGARLGGSARTAACADVLRCRVVTAMFGAAAPMRWLLVKEPNRRQRV